MPVHFIDNYPKDNLESRIRKHDGRPLFGELWLYREFLKFNENSLLPNETWYLKHNYNLSTHPSSQGKVEGQIDFLMISSYGLLVIEVKGGAIEVDENDVYYACEAKDRSNRYVAQNPFNQAKEYVHSLKGLINTNTFIYRAVVFPHESNFELKGPQLQGYQHIFFSRKDLDKAEPGLEQTKLFFNFLTELGKESRRHLIGQLHSGTTKDKIDKKAWGQYPLLMKKEMERLRVELFPLQKSYGFDPDRIQKELLLEENYEILKGLQKNQRVMIQGSPGTGKTVLATKFLADSALRNQKGIFFCANKLLRAKMEHRIITGYGLDPNMVSFQIFHKNRLPELAGKDIDFVIFDEAHEFFDKGLYEAIEELETKQSSPRMLLLYDTDQAIVQDYKDIAWYADFIQDSGFAHYHFSVNWRCAQNPQVQQIADAIRRGEISKLPAEHQKLISHLKEKEKRLDALQDLLEESRNGKGKFIILVESSLVDEFRRTTGIIFKKEIEELTDQNVHIFDQKVRYTTPIMFRGLESDRVALITSGLGLQNRTQNYVGITRAIHEIRVQVWD